MTNSTLHIRPRPEIFLENICTHKDAHTHDIHTETNMHPCLHTLPVSMTWASSWTSLVSAKVLEALACLGSSSLMASAANRMLASMEWTIDSDMASSSCAVTIQPPTHLFINHPLLSQSASNPSFHKSPASVNLSEETITVVLFVLGRSSTGVRQHSHFLFLAFLDYNANAKVHLVGNCNILQLSKLQFSFSQGYIKICLWFSMGKTSKLYHI